MGKVNLEQSFEIAFRTIQAGPQKTSNDNVGVLTLITLVPCARIDLRRSNFVLHLFQCWPAVKAQHSYIANQDNSDGILTRASPKAKRAFSKEARRGSKNRGSPQRKSAEATEDYLETINSLIDEKGYIASVDIAERMNVSKPTVTSIVKKLDKQGYVVHEKYRGLTLTEKGRELAKDMKRKHDLITKFLTLFGLEERTAREDAERIEHGLHRETLEKMVFFTEFAQENPEIFKRYKVYSSRGEQTA